MIEFARAAGEHSAACAPTTAGMHGLVNLRFGRRRDRTILLASRVQAPMALVRPFELADGRLVVQLVALGPGLCGGDTVHIDVVAEDGSEVLLTTTAATRVMTMEAGQRAEQHVHVRAGAGVSLEYYPALTIPFPASALLQTLAIEACATARIGLVEIWALGRAARDEYLQFRSLVSRTTLCVEGVCVYADALHLEPAADDVANAGVLEGRRYLAAGFFLGVDSVADAGSAPESERVDAVLAQSRPGLAYLRALADDAPALESAVQRSIGRVAEVWGRAPLRLDRFRC